MQEPMRWISNMKRVEMRHISLKGLSLCYDRVECAHALQYIPQCGDVVVYVKAQPHVSYVYISLRGT